MSVEETEETLTDRDNRIINQITVENEAAATALFDALMGQKVTERKEYIKAHSKEATYNV